jgi:hypothetical protein
MNIGQLMADYDRVAKNVARGLDFNLSQVVARDFMPTLSAINQIVASTFPAAAYSQQIAKILMPSSEALRSLTDRVLTDSMLDTQARIAANFADMARIMPPNFAQQLLESAQPSRRALDSLQQVFEKVHGLGVTAKQVNLTLGQFEGFTLRLAATFPKSPRSAADSAIAVDELATGSAILRRAAYGIHVAAEARGETEAHTDSAAILPPTAYDALADEVEERRGELLLLQPNELAEELRQTVSFQISVTATRILRLRHRCSAFSQVTTGEPIFKATVETELAAGMLAQWVASSEREFQEFIDFVYKYVYESSGSLKRLSKDFIDTHPVLMTIKWLRQYYRHDLDHGSPGEIKSKFLRIGNVFHDLVGVRLPGTPAIWRRAQLRILHQLQEALEDLCQGSA